MGEGRRETGMKWIHKALLLLIADILTIVFSYYAALVLRFDLRPWLVPGTVTAGLSVGDAVLDHCHSRDILRMQALPQYLAPRQRGGTAVHPDSICPADPGVCGRRFVHGSAYAGKLVPDGLYHKLLPDSGDPVLIQAASVLYANRSGMDHSKTQDRVRVMVIGAGQAGQTLIKELINSNQTDVKVCCIIDDNPE